MSSHLPHPITIKTSKFGNSYKAIVDTSEWSETHSILASLAEEICETIPESKQEYDIQHQGLGQILKQFISFPEVQHEPIHPVFGDIRELDLSRLSKKDMCMILGDLYEGYALPINSKEKHTYSELCKNLSGNNTLKELRDYLKLILQNGELYTLATFVGYSEEDIEAMSKHELCAWIGKLAFNSSDRGLHVGRRPVERIIRGRPQTARMTTGTG